MFIWNRKSLLKRVSLWNTLFLYKLNFLTSFQICVEASSTRASTRLLHHLLLHLWNFLQRIQEELLFLILLSSNIKTLWHTLENFLKCERVPNRSKRLNSNSENNCFEHFLFIQNSFLPQSLFRYLWRSAESEPCGTKIRIWKLYFEKIQVEI